MGISRGAQAGHAHRRHNYYYTTPGGALKPLAENLMVVDKNIDEIPDEWKRAAFVVPTRDFVHAPGLTKLEVVPQPTSYTPYLLLVALLVAGFLLTRR